jgi:hypothetical protein
MRTCTGFIWLRTGTNGRFHIRRGLTLTTSTDTNFWRTTLLRGFGWSVSRSCSRNVICTRIRKNVHPHQEIHIWRGPSSCDTLYGFVQNIFKRITNYIFVFNEGTGAFPFDECQQRPLFSRPSFSYKTAVRGASQQRNPRGWRGIAANRIT